MRARRRRRIALASAAVVLAPVVGWGAYAAITWLTFGRTRSARGTDPLMDRYMPRYDIVEVHRTRVAAPPSVTWSAARAMDLQDSPVVHTIFRARELILGATPGARPPHESFIDELLSIGWGVLADVPGRQMVFGAVTQPWQANVVFRALPPETFAAFDATGYVKIVVTIAVDSVGPRASMLRTETRALATDPASRAKFRRYWAVFSPGILLIRTEMLKLVRHEAEREAVR